MVTIQTSAFLGAETDIKTIAAAHSRCRSWVKSRNPQCPPMSSASPPTTDISPLGNCVPADASILPERLAQKFRSGEPIPPRQLRRLGDADPHPDPDLRRLVARINLERQAVERQPVVHAGHAHRLRQASRPGAEQPLVGNAVPPPAYLGQALERLHGA